MIYYSGVVNVVTCKHENASEVGTALCKSPHVAAMSFTGSTRVGKYIITANATQLRSLIILSHLNYYHISQDIAPMHNGRKIYDVFYEYF